MIHLDKRLSVMAGMMTPGGVGVDVGTDHGYLPVSLVETGRAVGMIAADINEELLQSAVRCISEHGLSDKIETVLCDGLTGIDLDDVTDIFIAGMGGVLITEILSARHPLVGKTLMLQPMTRGEELRQWLCLCGYAILEERCAVSAGKAYTVIKARYDGEARPCTPLFALVGKTSEDLSSDADAYLSAQFFRLTKKRDGLARSETPDQMTLSETEVLLKEFEALLQERKERSV